MHFYSLYFPENSFLSSEAIREVFIIISSCGAFYKKIFSGEFFYFSKSACGNN